MALTPRVVVAVPDRVECELLIEWLSAGHDLVPTRLIQGAIHQLRTRQPHLVVADARFAFDEAFLLICRGGGSATPLVVIGDPSAAVEAAAQRHGAFYVARPIDRDLLLCTVAMALADARPLRRSPRKPVARFDAVVDGTPMSLLDVSNEGLRLEVPAARRSSLRPLFTVRVPLFGVSVVVRRIWVSMPGSAASHGWCGGALEEQTAREVQKWRRFVDVVPRSA